MLAIEFAGRQIPIALLKQVKDDFARRYGDRKATIDVANTLNNEFGYVLLFISSSLVAKENVSVSL